MGNSKKLLKSFIFGGKPLSPAKKEASPNKSKNRWTLGKASSCINPADDVDDLESLEERGRREDIVSLEERGRREDIVSLEERGRREDTSIIDHVSVSVITGNESHSEATVNKPNNENLESDPAAAVNTHSLAEEDLVDEEDANVKTDKATCMEEQAAIVIQAAFRKFLCQRAFKSMKNGMVQQDQVEADEPTAESSSGTQSCIHDVRKLQSQVRSKQSQSPEEAKTVTRPIHERSRIRANNARVQDEWDHSTVPYDELQAKIQSKYEAAIRREKALAYASLQQLRICTTKKNQTLGLNWLERWMATRPIENCTEAVPSPYLDAEEQEAPQYGKVRKRAVNNHRAPCSSRLVPYGSNITKLPSPTKSSFSRVHRRSESEGNEPNLLERVPSKISASRTAESKTHVSMDEAERKDNAEQYEESCGSNVISIGSPKCESSGSSLDSRLVKTTVKSAVKGESTRLQAPHYMSTTRSAKAKAANLSDAKP